MKAKNKALITDITSSVEAKVSEAGELSKKVKKVIEKSAEKLAKKLVKVYHKEEKKKEKTQKDQKKTAGKAPKVKKVGVKPPVIPAPTAIQTETVSE